jgi:hypothetical protein
MASTASSASPSIWRRGEHDVSLVQLYVLRAGYFFFAADGFLKTLPLLIDHGPTERGMILGMKGGLWIMGMIGFRYPLQMLPILIFEFVWKTIWLLAFGLPQWNSGVGSPRLSQDMMGIAIVPLSLCLLLMPWGHVWRRYVRQPAERWR